MDQTSVVNAFAAAGLTRVAREVGRIALPSIRIRAQVKDEQDIPLGNSKLGGLPDLPPGSRWPALKGALSTAPAPMSFIAQIRLSDLRHLDAAKDLPSTGVLSFFYDAQQQTFGDKPSDAAGWAVIYHDGAPVPAQLARLPAPDDLPSEARFKACALTFEAEWTLPTDPSSDSPNLFINDDEQSKYEALLADYPTPDDHATIHHRLLGHPNTLQDDMRAQCQRMLEQKPGFGAELRWVQRPAPEKSGFSTPGVSASDASNWRLLLQVDSDENAGMRWANNGMLYFWIERSVLAARNFDQTWLVLQSE